MFSSEHQGFPYWRRAKPFPNREIAYVLTFWYMKCLNFTIKKGLALLCMASYWKCWILSKCFRFHYKTVFHSSLYWKCLLIDEMLWILKHFYGNAIDFHLIKKGFALLWYGNHWFPRSICFENSTKFLHFPRSINWSQLIEGRRPSSTIDRSIFIEVNRCFPRFYTFMYLSDVPN